MKKIFNKIKKWFKELKGNYYMKKNKMVVPILKKRDIYVLENNLCYVGWIESLERQVMQTKIDFAKGWINSESYDLRMEEYKKKIKDISDSYLEYMRRNKISIPKEVAAQYC